MDGTSFLQCEDKKQLQRQEYLLRDDWKAVLQYWLYVLFHEGDRKYQSAGSFWMPECHKPYLLQTSGLVWRVCGRFYS